MLSSKDLMARAGISRATLNNYIAMGLLPKPVVERGGGREAPPRLGYFPDDVLDTLNRIATLKQGGATMAQIVAALGAAHAESDRPDVAPPSIGAAAAIPCPSLGLAQAPAFPQVTVEAFEHPAYMVNKRFELEWWNEQAERQLLDRRSGLSSDIRARNIFELLLASAPLRQAAGREDLLRFKLSIAKVKLSKSLLAGADEPTAGESDLLDRLYDDVAPVVGRAMLDTEVNLASEGQAERWYTVYASFFREGVLFVFSPSSAERSSLLSWLARRDVVIRDILRRRRPYLTPLAVLVADLQDSAKISAELPPDDYFQLINRVWNAMEPNVRRFHATHGKHSGDGIVFYFFPQPDSHYVMNAIHCAQQMKQTMAEISREWRRRKGWLNDLRLNIGIDAGEEWFGTYQTTTRVEFTVLGETVSSATRLSHFARDSSLWVAKNLLGKLPASELSKIRFGIRRATLDGTRVVVPSTYARVSNLLDATNHRAGDFSDIAMSPVTEVFDLADGDGAAS